MTLPSKKRRNRRLRKKLHVGEFKEYGFDYEISHMRSLSQEDQETLIDRFLADVIECRNLCLGGGLSFGFVAAARGSVTEADRAAVEAWLRANLTAESIEVSQLKDAWYAE